jgi:thiosulfate/3-mercaptopyruvate sulfurtransferase
MARGAILWDVRPAEQYRAGHIPGAVNIGSAAEVLVDERTQLFPPVERIASRLGRAGIDLRKEIVVYGEAGSPYPYFAQFTLDYFNARTVHVFHDGFEGWLAARKAVSREGVARRAVAVRPMANPAMLVTTGEVLARLGRPDVQLVDTRPMSEFEGLDPVAARGGHIPGAIPIPMALNLRDGSTALAPLAERRRLYAQLDPRKETVVYGRTGVDAAMTAAILTRLGFRSVRLYHGSWLEYARDPEAPVQ